MACHEAFLVHIVRVVDCYAIFFDLSAFDVEILLTVLANVDIEGEFRERRVARAVSTELWSLKYQVLNGVLDGQGEFAFCVCRCTE